MQNFMRYRSGGVLIFVTFCQSKVNNVNIVFGHFSSANEEVIRFYISMDYTLLVDFLKSLYHLLGD